MPPFQNKPAPFFDLIIHDHSCRPGLTGACAGYEQGAFRNHDLADYLFEWLPEFALKYSELEEFNSGSAMRLVKQAAKTVYTTEKWGGEWGQGVQCLELRVLPGLPRVDRPDLELVPSAWVSPKLISCRAL